MHVCIVFYFQQLPWHTCNIFLSEEKLNKESNAQGFPVRRETPESLSLSLPVRLQVGTALWQGCGRGGAGGPCRSLPARALFTGTGGCKATPHPRK